MLGFVVWLQLQGRPLLGLSTGIPQGFVTDALGTKDCKTTGTAGNATSVGRSLMPAAVLEQRKGQSHVNLLRPLLGAFPHRLRPSKRVHGATLSRWSSFCVCDHAACVPPMVSKPHPIVAFRCLLSSKSRFLSLLLVRWLRFVHLVLQTISSVDVFTHGSDP